MKILLLGYVQEQWPTAERPRGSIGGLGEETEELSGLRGKLRISREFQNNSTHLYLLIILLEAVWEIYP